MPSLSCIAVFKSVTPGSYRVATPNISVVVKDLRLKDKDKDLMSKDEDKNKESSFKDKDKDKDLKSKDEDKDEDLSFKDKDKHLGRH